ncbi:MAG: hypothetical protein H6988_01550 [Pseudomonadales bacterium]|nr:hypothetical protein [Pseudomonadales bacterium]
MDETFLAAQSGVSARGYPEHGDGFSAAVFEAHASGALTVGFRDNDMQVQWVDLAGGRDADHCLFAAGGEFHGSFGAEVTVAGNDRALISGWHANQGGQLDALYASDLVLVREQVKRLVSAMAAFDVPGGVDLRIPEEAHETLQPVLASVWQEMA